MRGSYYKEVTNIIDGDMLNNLFNLNTQIFKEIYNEIRFVKKPSIEELYYLVRSFSKIPNDL